MEKITVTDRNERMYISYLYRKVSDRFSFLPADFSMDYDSDITTLTLKADKKYCPYIRRYAEDNIAEVIAVGYKYRYFRDKLMLPILSEEERDVLLTALVAADLPEDKEYIRVRLMNMNGYCIDGMYNFRLKELKNRWERIGEYIPLNFDSPSLLSFVDFLVEEGRGKAFLKDGVVYDEEYRVLTRSDLIGKKTPIREILLSGARQIYCLGKVDYRTMEFLKKYYKEKAIFC